MMDKIKLLYFIPAAIILLSFVIYLFAGKKLQPSKDNSSLTNNILKTLRYIPLLAIAVLIIGTYYLTNYYQKQISIISKEFYDLSNHKIFRDSSLGLNMSKTQIVDSLSRQNKELKLFLDKINNQEKITGKHTDLKNQINDRILSNTAEISKINSYNDPLDGLPNPAQKHKDSKEDGNLIFICPTDTVSDFIDFKFSFRDSNLFKKISSIFLLIDKRTSNTNYSLVFSRSYAARKGLNIFKIPNFLKDPSNRILFGYFLKSEQAVDSPIFYSNVCYSHLDIPVVVEGFLLLPDPVHDTLTVKFNSSDLGYYRLIITDSEGRYLYNLMRSKTTHDLEIKVPVSKYAAGNYPIIFQIGNRVINSSFKKE